MPRSLRHFPVHDRAHVVNALARIAQGAEFGKQALPKVKAAAKKHGVEHEGIEDEDEEGGEKKGVAAARRYARAGVVSLSADEWDDDLLELADQDLVGGPLEEIQNRHPDLFKPGKAGIQSPAERLPYEQQRRKGKGFRPSRPGQVTTRSRAHGEDEDPSDSQQPHRGGDVHPEVDRYLRMHREFSGAEKPHGSVRSHPPRPGRRAG